MPAGQERDELDGELRHERLVEKDGVDEAVVDGRLCGELELAPRTCWFEFLGWCCQNHAVTIQGRPYAGASRETRESARWEQIMGAGIELFGS
ncbi:hypothetical protein GCM10009690_21330 [Brevibacterium permense]|uniref:Uncharacterized protein n=1 Tax=Brevibacterium permense TaxID=234834 RepID=A0ABP4LA28_9MICO